MIIPVLLAANRDPRPSSPIPTCSTSPAPQPAPRPRPRHPLLPRGRAGAAARRGPRSRAGSSTAGAGLDRTWSGPWTCSSTACAAFPASGPMKNLSAMAFGFARSQILYAATQTRPARCAGRRPHHGRVPGRASRHGSGLPAPPAARPGRAGRRHRGPSEPLRAVGLRAAAPGGSPRSIRSSVLLLGDPATWHAWGALTESVRTGETAWDHVHGRPLFEHLASARESCRRSSTPPCARAPARWRSSSRSTSPGKPSWTSAAATAPCWPRSCRGPRTPGACCSTRPRARPTPRRCSEDVADRCRIENGDFFDAVPGGDVIILKGILHDWDDDTCVRLLRGCRKSLWPGGRLLVIEPVMPENMSAPEASGVVMSDIAMLVYTGGRERTQPEFAAVLAAAGFTLTQVSDRLGGSPIRGGRGRGRLTARLTPSGRLSMPPVRAALMSNAPALVSDLVCAHSVPVAEKRSIQVVR